MTVTRRWRGQNPAYDGTSAFMTPRFAETRAGAAFLQQVYVFGGGKRLAGEGVGYHLPLGSPAFIEEDHDYCPEDPRIHLYYGAS